MANEFISREEAIQFVEEHMNQTIEGYEKNDEIRQIYEMAIKHAINWLRIVPSADVVKRKNKRGAKK